MIDCTATVKDNRLIAENIRQLTVTLSENAPEIRGGQFLNISTGGDRLLRRPLGIMKAEGRDITVCFQVKGDGTAALAGLKAGEEVKTLLPLGNGFDLSDAHKIAVIGGGVGIFPLIATVRQYSKNKNFYVYFGFRNSGAVCLIGDVKPYAKTFTAVTDDGSFGDKGNAVQAFLSDYEKNKFDLIIACGPPVMFKVLKQRLAENGITTPCLVSLEERMGCGIGACLVCACKTKDGVKRVCADGPVFDINEAEL